MILRPSGQTAPSSAACRDFQNHHRFAGLGRADVSITAFGISALGVGQQGRPRQPNRLKTSTVQSGEWDWVDSLARSLCE